MHSYKGVHLLSILFLLGIYVNGQKVLKGHSKPIISVSFSKDSKQLGSVSSDKTINIWNVSDGSLEKTLYDNNDGEVSLAFTPDEKYLVSGSWDTAVKIWDLKEDKIIRRMNDHTAAIRTVNCNPNGGYVASAGWDLDIFIWHTYSGINFQSLKGHKQCVRSICYSPDGKLLASGGYDLDLKIWDLKTGNELYSLSGHKYPIESVTFSPDGKMIATGSVDNTIKLWNPSTGELIETIKDHEGTVYSVCFSSDSKYLASASYDKTVKIRDINAKKSIKTFTGHTQAVKTVSFSPDGKSLASAGNERVIRLWDVSSLGITPQPTKELIDNTKYGILSWSNLTQDRIEVYDNKFNLKALNNNSTYKGYKLFVNGKEHIEYDGNTKFQVKPSISISGNGTSIDYSISLHEGSNRVQLYADNGAENMTFSPSVEIVYKDLSKQIQSMNLFVHSINIGSYADKKVNSGYSSSSSTILNNLTSGKGKLYKDVIISGVEGKGEATSDGIEDSFAEFKTKPTYKDIAMVCISGHIGKDSEGGFYLIPSDAKKGAFDETVVDFAAILAALKKMPAFVALYIDASNSFPSADKTYFAVDNKTLGEFVEKSLKGKIRGYSISVSENGLFKTISSPTDKDDNNALTIFELNSLLGGSTYNTGSEFPLMLLK